jgi:hypothetical protein
MKIVVENIHTVVSKRVLINDNEQRIDISDDSIIQYTGIYYKEMNDIVNRIEIETTFIGIVEGEKFNLNSGGIKGIYVKPLYIWDLINSEWKKIINYKKPTTKYFFYPHLLCLPDHTYGGNKPLYFLHTCENTNLVEFSNIINTFQI